MAPDFLIFFIFCVVFGISLASNGQKAIINNHFKIFNFMKTNRIFAAFLLLLVAFSTHVMSAQQMPDIPVDEAVKIGKLDNGLTYYIRHNDYPEHKANFYIAQRVGSLQEEENQRGLAHFLEHMAFNGSEHFPGNGIIDFTRSLGLNFGEDLNAETGFFKTVYHVINVPSTRQSALDSCLLILKDWSHGLLLEDEEIDKERGVIHQEWRDRNTATLRMLNNLMDYGFPGSKFSERMPIGLLEVVDNFPYQALRDYYHTWYRPDNQALVIVGDIDVDDTEAKIREMFKDIPASAADAPKVQQYPVPDNEEGLYITFKDKELPQSSISVFFKHDPVEREMKSNMSYLLTNYLKSMMCSMFNLRLNEMAQEEDCPYAAFNCLDGDYLVSNTKSAFAMDIIPKDGMALAALQKVLTEIKRVKQHGFTASEYERASQMYLSNLEARYNQRDKISNDEFGQSCCKNFIEGEPIVTIETYYELMNSVVPQINVDVINMGIQQMLNEMVVDSERNMVIVSNEVDMEGAVHPTIEGMKEAVAAARVAPVDAFVDNVKQEPLIANLPKPGKIVKERVNKQLGYTELELSNGARVILKPTDFKDNEIQMEAVQRGGKSLYGEKDWANLQYLNEAIMTGGLGEFSANEFQKAIAGKQIRIIPQIGTYFDKISGVSTVKDLETFFQFNYLLFTDKRKDEKTFNQFLSIIKPQLDNKGQVPDNAIKDTLNYVMDNYDWRGKPFNAEDLNKIDLDRVMEIAQERTANAAGYTFYFVGDFDDATIRPLIEQYIASLPAKKGVKPHWENVKVHPSGQKTVRFSYPMETPKTQIQTCWYDDAMPFTLENEIKVELLGNILDKIFMQMIREDAGAAYTTEAYGYLNLYGDRHSVLVDAICPVKPEFTEEALSIMNTQMAEAAKHIDAASLDSFKNQLLKDHVTALKENGYWMWTLQYYVERGLDMHTGYEDLVKAQTPESIAAFARKLLTEGNKVEIVMTPAE